MDLRKSATRIVALTLITMISGMAQASSLQAQSLKQKISDSKVGWQAKENHLTQLSVEQLKRMMGYSGHVPDVTLTKVGVKAYNESVIDWRNRTGQNWVSPILDQGNCGSCVAFATIGALETQINISRNLSWLNPKLSPQALFACGGGSCDMGWMPDSAVSYVQQSGVPDEACMPYTSGATGLDAACESSCADTSSRSQKISSYRSLSGPDEIKQALADGPVITTLNVYADFVLYSSGIYKHTAGDVLGGHAVSIVGYNDQDRYWIIRNSWSGDWGESGFANVSYDDDSGVGQEGWSMAIPSAAGVVAIKNLADRDYHKTSFTFNAASTVPGTTQLALHLVAADGGKTDLTCAQAACDFKVDLSKITDGQVTAVLVASDASKELARSEEKYFYTMNSDHASQSLNYTGKNLDLSQPVSGRIEFNVNAQATPVPFTELEFLVFAQDGTLVRDHVSKNVAPQTVLGWRTPTVPNGSYKVQLLGKIIVDDKTYTTDAGTISLKVQN